MANSVGDLSKSKTSSSSAKFKTGTVPNRIKIRREKRYHTHYIGKIDDGTQFMAFIVGVPPTKKAHGRKRNLVWYGVLHMFDSQGRHLRTQSSLLGAKAFANELLDVDATLDEMVRKLGKTRYSDIEVELFSVQIDGHKFGLVDASIPEEGYVRIDLLPNQLAFFPPWDGTYST
jgi:formate hydrogenlyase regulatory protein HycA